MILQKKKTFPIIHSGAMADTREKALQDYRKKLLEHKEVDGRLKERRKLFEFNVCGVTGIYFLLKESHHNK